MKWVGGAEYLNFPGLDWIQAFKSIVINIVGSAAEGFRFTMRPASIYFVSAAGSGLAGGLIC